jgi:ABC-type Na+ efflux pump permease subunit
VWVEYTHMVQDSTYHNVLRVSAVVCAFVLMFVSGIVNESTARLSQDTQQYLANAIGANASVQPTELNKFTAALTEQQRDLDLRELKLNEREIAVNISAGGTEGSDTTTYILASVLFILLVLILLNYALDYLREREESMIQTV